MISPGPQLHHWPGVRCARAITDFEVTQEMVGSCSSGWRIQPSAGSDLRAVAITAVGSGRSPGSPQGQGHRAQLIEQPMAAAIPARAAHPSRWPTRSSTSAAAPQETPLISLGGIVALQAVRVGGFRHRRVVITYIRRGTGSPSVSRYRVKISSAPHFRRPRQECAPRCGVWLMSGLPRAVSRPRCEPIASRSTPWSTRC